MRFLSTALVLLTAACGSSPGSADGVVDQVVDLVQEEIVPDVVAEETEEIVEVVDVPEDEAEEIEDAVEEDGREYERGSLDACLLDPACNRVGVLSHMGAWTASIPGNSMAAYIRAWELGAEGIEADVRVSADGVPFMIHNDEITLYESLLCAGRVVSESPASDIDGCLLVPSLTETVPTFEELVTWARGRIIIHLDVKDSENIEVMVREILRHGAEDFAFIAVSVGEARTLLPGIPDADRVYFMIRVNSVADVDEALGPLASPNVFMLEGDRSWDSPLVSETEMLGQVARTHAAGLRIMASSVTYLPSVDDHLHLYDMGFDMVLSYNAVNGVEASRIENISRGYPP